MRRSYLTAIVCAGAFAFLVLVIADWRLKAGADRLSNVKLSPQTNLKANPN